VRLAKALDLHHLPWIVSEDASAAVVRLDIKLRNGRMYLYGTTTGGCYEIKQPQHIYDLLEQHSIATQIYVYVIAALVPHGMFIPIYAVPVDGTRATLSSSIMRERWALVRGELIRHGFA
jgi:hypothetical protein